MKHIQRIYFDNAATTKVREEVLNIMLPYFKEKFGNPSSIHSFGREVKKDLEMARKKVATLLGTTPSEIFFTSGGTESMNTAILGLLQNCSKEEVVIITTKIEHHATLHSIETAHDKFSNLNVIYLSVDGEGNISLDELRSHLEQEKNKKIIVCLMAANNEVGTISDIEKIGHLCHEYQAIFICDMVQWIGHYETFLNKMPVDIATASGHKFHAPKGVGIIYIHHQTKCSPIVFGGSQERNMRAGTENIAGIIALSEALELQMKGLEEEKKYIYSLKAYFIEQLLTHFKDCKILGNSEQNLYSLVNVGFPKNEKTEMLVYQLDMKGIAVSSGSACSSGTNVVSHVIQELGINNIVPMRFSFSTFNTKDEIDESIATLKSILIP